MFFPKSSSYLATKAKSSAAVVLRWGAWGRIACQGVGGWHIFGSDMSGGGRIVSIMNSAAVLCGKPVTKLPGLRSYRRHRFGLCCWTAPGEWACWLLQHQGLTVSVTGKKGAADTLWPNLGQTTFWPFFDPVTYFLKCAQNLTMGQKVVGKRWVPPALRLSQVSCGGLGLPFQKNAQNLMWSPKK